MTTVQSYGEGDSHANNLEQSAQKPDLTANSANPAVSADTPAATSALSEFLKSPKLSEFNRTLLEHMKKSGASDELVLKTGQRLHEHFPTQVPTKPAPKPKEPVSGDTGYRLDMSILQRSGTSRADVIAFALDEYYNDRMKKAFNEVRAGEFEVAHNHYHDAQTAYWTILEMLLKANDMADRNYRATKGEEQNRFSDDSTYRRFLKDYLEIDPATQGLD
ncbi:hypothetical protein [Spirosoma validum]|uniref:Uncharacterized protein n=1 Tax=Spirosoma validum TaxID=2771355 RepID=A0A927B816_9BACT|nr:hypothetical protein [Spirosoma validum]MBD2757170.1 hypothetical protein [Spirosoma validum]